MKNVKCPICSESLRFSLATSRKAKHKKTFVMLVCPNDGRHFRGFISDQAWVGRLIEANSDTNSDSTQSTRDTARPIGLRKS